MDDRLIPFRIPQSAFRNRAVVAVALAFCQVSAADAPVVTVRTVTEDNISGRPIEFSLQHGLTLYTDATNGQRHFPAGDVVYIVTDYRPVPAAPDSVRIELAGRDLLLGRVIGFDADLIEIDSPTIGRVRVPLERIERWKTPAADHPRLHAAVEALFARDHTATDALLLVNGDLLPGFVAAIDRHGFLLETDAGESRVKHESVAAAAMVPVELRDLPGDRTGGPTARIVTTDGQRLSASTVEWSDGLLALTIFGDLPQRIPTDRVARIDVTGGRWQWLTDLEPISYQHTPALALDWNWRINRNVTGGPLQVAGKVYEHGLGVHSQCSITFDLTGAFSEFVTSMGLDDGTAPTNGVGSTSGAGPYADVDVEIRVDGQLRFTRQNITPGKLHGPIRLDVNDARRIKLSVLFGRNADLQDRFNWIEPALVK